MIYSVQVLYHHNRHCFGSEELSVCFVIDIESEKLHSKVEQEAERLLSENGFEWRHQYSFPDGSICKWIKTSLDNIQLQKELDLLFKPIEKFHSVIIEAADPKQKPYKVRWNAATKTYEDVLTLEEYFNG